MSAWIGSKVPASGYLASTGAAGGRGIGRPALPSVPWLPSVRGAFVIVGLLLAVVGIAIDCAVLWTQLARALPVMGVLHHPRAIRALYLTVAGLGVVLASAHRARRQR